MESYNNYIYMAIVLCVISTILSLSSSMDVIITSSDGRIRGVRNTQDSDFVLGGLFAVHSNQESERSCKEIRCRGGIDRVVAMLLAIDEINRDPQLLPNLTLGYDIRDTCNEEHNGLDEAATLILSGTNSALNSEHQCSPNNTATAGIQKGVVGLVGAGSSRVSIPIGSLTRLFETPQISYSSTSAILSNRELYPYFFRTISSDTKVAMAIVDMLQHFNWTLISTIFTRDSYGQSGIDDLHDVAKEHGICVDISEGIEIDFKDNDYTILAEKISTNSKANVIILYAHREAAQRLLSKMVIVAEKQFTWIATNAWSTDTVVGLFGVIPTISTVSNFTEHFNRLLTDMDSTRNHWFSEFLQCNGSYDQDYAIPRVIDAVYTFAHALNNYLNENCAQPITWIPENRTCVGVRRQLTGSLLLEYIRNTSFIGSSGMMVNFDSEGGVQPLYDIVNYRLVDNEVNMSVIGTWNSMHNTDNTKNLKINNAIQIHYGLDVVGEAIVQPTESHCGRCEHGEYLREVPSSLDELGEAIVQPTESHCGRCEPGEYLREVPSSCCGLCEPCLGQNFSNSSSATECLNCSSFGDLWGNNPTTGSSGCVPIPQIFLDFSDPWSIVIMSTTGEQFVQYTVE